MVETPREERQALLGKFAEAIAKHREDLMRMLGKEQGKARAGAEREVGGSAYWAGETANQTAVDFLTKTGQMCSGEWQEFILLSDVLGCSMLVDTINQLRRSQATENTVLGPFHAENAPFRENGATISLDGKGEACLLERPRSRSRRSAGPGGLR